MASIRSRISKRVFRSKGTDRPAISEKNQSATYTETDWDGESYTLFAERGDPAGCPECGRTGFYGPRAAGGGRKYRECRFCGFAQDVGQPPIRLGPTVHGCEEWPACAKAPYVWWVHPNEESYKCPYCGKKVTVISRNFFAKSALITGPSEDPEHPWWRVPQNRTYAYYLRFWENWPITKGRVFL